MKIAVTGATGFVGRRVCFFARQRGHDVVTLSRTEGDRLWNPLTEPAPLADIEAVIHLAGESLIKGRWTRRKMDRIRMSRVVGTRNLAKGIQASRARILVSASAVGFYGDRGDDELTEGSMPGTDFLASVCRDWEAEAVSSGVRTVLMRTATVLGPGGALEKMLPPFRAGLGGKLGSGRQWMSWIHRDDLAHLYVRAAEYSEFSGPVIAASPHPVRNLDFTDLLGRILDRPTPFRLPRWGLRIAFGKVASVLFASQRCRPQKLRDSGVHLRFPILEAALRDALAVLFLKKVRAKAAA